MITAYPRYCLAGFLDRLQRYPQVLADKEPGLIFNPLKNMVDVMVMKPVASFSHVVVKAKPSPSRYTLGLKRTRILKASPTTAMRTNTCEPACLFLPD